MAAYLAAGETGPAVLAAIGGLYTGLAVSTGVYRARIRNMVLSGSMIGAGTALGAAVGGSFPLSILAVFGTALYTSLYASTSRAAATIGAQTTALLCIVVGLGLKPSSAVIDGIVVLSGSAVQLLLITVVWPIRSGTPERRVVAEAYESLARFVMDLDRRPTTSAPLIPTAAPLQEARTILIEAEPFGWTNEHARLFAEVRRAEAMRAALVGFARADLAFAESGQAAVVRAQRVHVVVATALLEIAEKARHGQLDEPRRPIKLAGVESFGALAAEFDRWTAMVLDLLRQSFEPGRLAKPVLEVKPKSLFSKITRLPDIKSLRSVTFQHALRYALAVEAAFLISHEWNHTRSYWLPMTVALVLRQDYGSTFQRALARVIGTIGGLLLADAVIQLFHPSPLALQVLTVAATWFAFVSVQASYTVLTVAVTGFVVFSVASSGVAPAEISWMRMASSLAGVGLAVFSYVIWPAWNWKQVWATLKATCHAQVEFASVLLSAHAHADNLSREVDEARIKARSLRIQSEGLVQAVRYHPLGRRPKLLATASAASQQLEETAAIMLLTEAEWRQGAREAGTRLEAALRDAEMLEAQLATL